jgi:hypothetical protein
MRSISRLGGVSDAQFHRFVARLDAPARLIDELRRFLVAERYAACVSRDRFAGAAQQPAQRHAGRLSADVPQREIDPTHRQARSGAHAVASQLHLVDLRPDADGIGRVHAEDELAQRGLDQFCDRGCARGRDAIRPSR